MVRIRWSGKDSLSGEETLLKLFYLPFENESALKGKN